MEGAAFVRVGIGGGQVQRVRRRLGVCAENSVGAVEARHKFSNATLALGLKVTTTVVRSELHPVADRDRRLGGAPRVGSKGLVNLRLREHVTRLALVIEKTLNMGLCRKSLRRARERRRESVGHERR